MGATPAAAPSLSSLAEEADDTPSRAAAAIDDRSVPAAVMRLYASEAASPRMCRGNAQGSMLSYDVTHLCTQAACESTSDRASEGGVYAD